MSKRQVCVLVYLVVLFAFNVLHGEESKPKELVFKKRTVVFVQSDDTVLIFKNGETREQ